MSQSSPALGRNDLAVLLFILLLAAALRAAGLNAPLWYDEVWTVDTHIRLPWGEMMREYSMNHHYFFSMKAKLVSQAFGEHAWAYKGKTIAHHTIAIGEQRVFLIDSTITSEQRAEILPGRSRKKLSWSFKREKKIQN